MHHLPSIKETTIAVALRKVRQALKIAVNYLKHNAIKCILNHYLYEFYPTSKDELELLSELEVQIGSNFTVKHRLVLRTHTLPIRSVRKVNYSVDKVAQ
jgi:hypothetical protein